MGTCKFWGRSVGRDLQRRYVYKKKTRKTKTNNFPPPGDKQSDQPLGRLHIVLRSRGSLAEYVVDIYVKSMVISFELVSALLETEICGYTISASTVNMDMKVKFSCPSIFLTKFSKYYIMLILCISKSVEAFCYFLWRWMHREIVSLLKTAT